MTELEKFFLQQALAAAEKYAPGATAFVQKYLTAENADNYLQMAHAVITAMYNYVPASGQNLLQLIDAEILKIDGLIVPAQVPDPNAA